MYSSVIGIAPDILSHVFELFVQADNASTKSQGGLGIGLTLVKNLVEMHSGTVGDDADPNLSPHLRSRHVPAADLKDSVTPAGFIGLQVHGVGTFPPPSAP